MSYTLALFSHNIVYLQIIVRYLISVKIDLCYKELPNPNACRKIVIKKKQLQNRKK